jgi:PAS domain S-box-containing protein
MSREEIQKAVHELQVHQIELEMQNEELRGAQGELNESRDRIADLYDSAPVGYLTLDSDAYVIEGNLTAAAMLGVERKKLVGRSFTRFVTRGAQDVFYFHQRAVLGAESKQLCELVLRGPESTTFHARMESISVPDPATGTRHCRSAIIDITEQKLAEEALARSHAELESRVNERTADLVRANEALRVSEERYRQLVHALPVAIFTSDAQGRITLYNAAATALWGREPVLGRERWDGAHRLLTPDGKRLPTSRYPIAMAIRQDEPIRESELIVERPNGSRSHVLAFVEPIHDSSGTVVGAVKVMVDITALKVAENALRNSERSLRTLSRVVEQSPASVLITGTTGQIEYVNPTFTRVTGYSLREVLGQNPRILKSGQQPAKIHRELWQTITAGKTWRGQLCNRRKNGELFWEFAVIAPIQDEHGTVTHFVAIKEDITERKRAEDALAESKQRLAGIVGSAMDAIVSVDGSQRIVLFNTAAEAMFRCSARDAIGTSIERFIPQRLRAAHAGYITRFGESGVTSRAMGEMGAICGLRADGEEFPIEASISQIEVGGEKLFTVILRDITERRRLEQEVLEIGAREQLRIGQEMHDDVCQWLAGSEFLSSALATDLAKHSPAEAARARDVVKGIRQSLTRAHMLVHGLVPTVIESAGLAGALRELAANAGEMFHIRCLYDAPETVPVKDSGAALHLYRIAQEAISNAVRHGGAREVRISIQSHDARVTMLIKDDGCGIPQPLPQTGGMGLRTMRYRAGIIGATLEIRPGAGGGTEVICNFPKDL